MDKPNYNERVLKIADEYLEKGQRRQLLNFANSVYYNSSIKSIKLKHPLKGTADHTTQPSIPLNTAKPQMNVAAPEIVQPDRSANDTKVINVCYKSRPASCENIYYNYPEMRIDDNQEIYLDICGRVCLNNREYHSFAQANFLLNTMSKGEIFYISNIAEKKFTAFKTATESGFDFAFTTDWSNVIPIGKITGFEPCSLEGQISFYCKDGNGGKDPIPYSVKFSVDENFTPGGSKTFQEVDRIQLLCGCIHEDSRIRMRDNIKMAKDLRTGDMVMSASGNGVSRVADVLVGQELQMWSIKAEDAPHTLCVTQGHPILTRQGYKVPETLAEGDELLLESGAFSKFEFAHTSGMDCRVVNLILEGENHTFYADGYAVGDQIEQMQLGRLCSEHKTDSSESLRQEIEKLQKEWTSLTPKN